MSDTFIKKSTPWLLNETISPHRRELEKEWDKLSRDADRGEDFALVSRAFMAMRAERPVQPMLGPSNHRALRWFERRIREGRAAAQLRKATPHLPLLKRLQLHWLGLTAPVLSCCLTLLIHTRLVSAMDEIRKDGEQVASIHVARHINSEIV